MKTTFLLISILILSFSTIASAGVIVDKTSFDITAGDSFILTYTLTGSSSVCHVSVNITPDPVGFNLSYTPIFNVPSTFYLHVNTSIFLSPGVYTITSTFSTESSSSPKVTNHIHNQPVLSPVNSTSPVNNTTPEIPDNDTNENDTIPQTPIVYEGGFDFVPLVLVVVISACLLLSFFIVRKHKKENKNK